MKAVLFWLAISLGGLFLALQAMFLLRNAISQDLPPLSPSSKPEQEVIIAKSVNFNRTVLITGSIIKDNNRLLSELGVLRTIIEKHEVSERGCVFSATTEDATLVKSINSVTSSILSTPVQMKVKEQAMIADHTKVATFTLYLVMHDQGSIKHSGTRGGFFDCQVSQSAGTVQVFHSPHYKPATIDESGNMFFCLMQALEPLCMQLECTHLWIRAIETNSETQQLVETTGIVWGGKDPSVNVIFSTPLISTPSN